MEVLIIIEEVIGAGNLGAVAHNLVFAPVEMGANAVTLEWHAVTY